MKTLLLVFVLLLFLPLVSGVQIDDTTFFASETSYTIFVDSITLDQVFVSNVSIIFHNLTSLGSNFTNSNETFDAVASFIGLETGFTIRNINLSLDLFTSGVGSQDFNATFISGHTIRVIIKEITLTQKTCNSSLNNISSLSTVMQKSFPILALFVLVIIRSNSSYEHTRQYKYSTSCSRLHREGRHVPLGSDD